MKISMIKKKISSISAIVLTAVFMAAIMLCADGASAKRRTLKASTPTNQAAVTTESTPNVVTPESTVTTESRSARRRAALPAETEETVVNISKEKTTPIPEKKETAAKSTTKSSTKTTAKTTQASKGKSQGGLRRIEVKKPDLDEIRTATLDPKSKFYFPELWKKYMAKDTIMSPEEFRYLYLGYMFQEDYDPYRTSPYNEYTDIMRDKKSFTTAELRDVINNSERALDDNPFDLREMSFLVHMLNEHGKKNKAKIWEFRMENILGAIKSTGTGENVENAWYVIYPMHEYDMVQLMGYRAVDVDYVDSGFDHLLVEPDGTVKHKKPVSGFYFNVEVPQKQYLEKHPEDQDEVAADMGGEEEE